MARQFVIMESSGSANSMLALHLNQLGNKGGIGSTTIP
jgi:hypothetical protein